MITIQINCWNCSKDYPVTVKLEDLADWYNQTKLIQNAMPYLSVDDRELLISQTCPFCYEMMYGPQPIPESECWYCGETCPVRAKNGESVCDGYAGDIDGLYSEKSED